VVSMMWSVPNIVLYGVPHSRWTIIQVSECIVCNFLSTSFLHMTRSCGVFKILSVALYLNSGAGACFVCFFFVCPSVSLLTCHLYSRTLKWEGCYE
jgi:hypothetical protein